MCPPEGLSDHPQVLLFLWGWFSILTAITPAFLKPRQPRHLTLQSILNPLPSQLVLRSHLQLPSTSGWLSLVQNFLSSLLCFPSLSPALPAAPSVWTKLVIHPPKFALPLSSFPDAAADQNLGLPPFPQSLHPPETLSGPASSVPVPLSDV